MRVSSRACCCPVAVSMALATIWPGACWAPQVAGRRAAQVPTRTLIH